MGNTVIKISGEGNAATIIKQTANAMRDFNKAIADGDKILSSGHGGISLNQLSSGSFSKSFLALNPQLKDLMASQKNIRLESMNDLPRRGISQQMIDLQAQIAQGDYDLNNYKGPKPPIIKQAGIGGRLGQVAKVLGIEPGSALGNVLLGLGAFRVALWTMQPVIDAVKAAFHALAESIREGSKLFTDSAKIGTSQFRLAHARSVGNLLNISPEEMDRLLEQGQFGIRRQAGGVAARSTTSRTGGASTFLGSLLGGRGPEQLAALQQLTNLQKEAIMADKDMAASDAARAMSARTLFEVEYNAKVVLADLNGVMQDFTALISGPLKAGLASLDLVIRGFLLNDLNTLVAIGKKLNLIPNGQDFNQSLGAGRRIPVSHFERMGFHIGSVPGTSVTHDAAKTTAQNTSHMVSLLEKIVHFHKGLAAGAMAGGLMNVLPNLP